MTNAESAALSYVAADPQEWIDNAAHERARIAIEEIVAITLEQCLKTGTQVPGSKDEMVLLAFEKNWIVAAASRNQEL